ncbi:MAG: glycosyltransferase, partial [Mucinivorans sp.]
MESYLVDTNIQNSLFGAFVVLDSILYVFYLIAVGYLLIFAIGANIKKNRHYMVAKKNYRYAVLFYVDNKENRVVQSVRSFLEQDYPAYRVMVVSNVDHAQVNEQLSRLPIDVLMADVAHYNKAQAVRYAISVIDDQEYDVVVLMDSDSEVDTGFLGAINDAYYQGGMVIQTHRATRNLDS